MVTILWLLASSPGWGQTTRLTLFPELSVNQKPFGFAKMVAAPDGGFAVLQVHDLLGDIHVLRFDPCGELRWARYVTMDLLYRPTRASDLVFTPDGILHAGVMHHASTGHFSLLRFADDGSFLGARSWGYYRMSAGVYSMGLMPDGQIFLTGINYPASGPTDFTALVDSAGDLSAVHGFMQSSSGYQTVGAASSDGYILLRRGDHFSLVDPYSGAVIWRRDLGAPLYNGVIPVHASQGWLLLGQFSNSIYNANAVPVFIDEEGDFLFLGEMFPANGNTFFLPTENIQMRRVFPISGNRFVTVTTDSIEKGILSAVILSEQGKVLEQRHVNPDPDQYRLLNHDFALLPGDELAIAANLDGKLAILRLPLNGAPGCESSLRKDVLPYNTGVSPIFMPSFRMDTLRWEPLSIEAKAEELIPAQEVLCETLPVVWPDTTTRLRLCPGNSVLVDASHPAGTAFLWEDGSRLPQRTLTSEGMFLARVYIGCESYLHTFVVEASVPCDCPPTLPNLFTPDGDGVNDRFGEVYGCIYPGYLLRVYSRWGLLVFESTDGAQGWDGTFRDLPLPADTYGWVLEWLEDSGKGEFTQRGSVTLLR